MLITKLSKYKSLLGILNLIVQCLRYKFDIAKCMFSFGNINEKLRISKINCDGETIVDLFAGIGYFTLPFLVHCKANKVYACDWNPYAIEALKENLTINKVADRCHVLFGDCREVCPIDVANRVCLGLIPSSKIGWETACKAIRKDLGGIFHLHQNITTFGLKSKVLKKKAWLESGQEIANEIAQIFKRLTNTNWNVEIVAINPVKSYAPHIDHLVYDLNCRPFMDTN